MIKANTRMMMNDDIVVLTYLYKTTSTGFAEGSSGKQTVFT